MTSSPIDELRVETKKFAKTLQLSSRPIRDPFDLLGNNQISRDSLEKGIAHIRSKLKKISDRELLTEEAFDALIVLAAALTLRGYETQRFNEAYQVASQAVSTHPYHWKARCLRGQIALLRSGKGTRWIDSAIDDFTLALVSVPKDLISLFGRGLCHEIPAVRQLEKVHTLRTLGRSRQAQKCLIQAEKQLIRALEDFTKITQEEPNHGLALLHRGQCLSRLGQLESALADLTRALDLGESAFSWSSASGIRANLSTAACERGQLYAALGDHKKALEDLCLAVELAGSEQELTPRRHRASIAFRAGAMDLVIEDCSRLLREGADESLLLLRANAYLDTNNLNLARSDASRILQSNRSSLEARLIRARCSARLQAWHLALADFDRCLQLHPLPKKSHFSTTDDDHPVHAIVEVLKEMKSLITRAKQEDDVFSSLADLFEMCGDSEGAHILRNSIPQAPPGRPGTPT